MGATGSIKRLFDTGMLTCRMGFDSTGIEQWSGPVEQMTVGRAAHAVIVDFDESVRQDGLKTPTNKIFGREGTEFALLSGRFFVRKRDVAILQLEAVLMADGHAKDRRGKRSEGLLATADGLTVNHPVFFPYVLIDLSEQVGLLPLVSARGAEDD